MTERAQPTDLELAALISSKICHDVIGPVGAIYNGLEILDEDDDAEAKTYALDVIRNVTEQASARLQFARFAFGAAGSAGAQIDLATAEQISRGLMGQGKHKLAWRGMPGQMAKDKVKLLLNLIASAITALPRGGEIEVAIAGSLEQAELPVALPRHGRPPAAVSGRLRRRRAAAAARCHVDPGLLHVAAGRLRAHAARDRQGRRRHRADAPSRWPDPAGHGRLMPGRRQGNLTFAFRLVMRMLPVIAAVARSQALFARSRMKTCLVVDDSEVVRKVARLIFER